MAHPVSSADYPAESFRFGVFEVDPKRGEIRKSGIKLRLQDQPFRLLLALLERPGEIISREQLRQLLWAGDTVVEFDLAVNTAVHKLREVLLDSATTPRYVETVPKRGYRFIAPVERIGGAVAPVAVPALPRRQRWPVWVGSAAAVVVVALVGFSVMPGHEAPAPVISSLTTYAGFEWGPTLSPDGSQVAFTWSSDRRDNLDIYVKVVGPDSPLRLTTDAAPDMTPSWSPNGRHIAFLRVLPDGKIALMVMTPLGGGSRVVAEGAINRDRAAWTPDSKWLLAASEGKSGTSAIRAYSVADGTSHAVTTPADKQSDYSPTVSPNGKWLVFSRGADYRHALLNVALNEDVRSSGEPVRLTPATFDVQAPMAATFLDGGREILFHTKGSGGPQLWRVSILGGEPKPVTVGGVGLAWQPDYSPRSERLVFTQSFEQENLYAVSLARGSAHEATALQSVFSTKRTSAPHFSPDGKRITFSSDRSGHTEIWVSDRDGGQPRVLTSFGGAQTGTPKFSPDGKWIVFDTRAGNNAQLYLVRPDGGGLERFSLDDEESKVPDWSHDGKWIYFVSGRSGSNQVWKLPVEVGRGDSRKGKAFQVTRGGGYVPQASSDGKWIYFTKHDGWVSPLWRISTNGGEERQVLPAVINRTFYVARSGVYFGQRATDAWGPKDVNKWTLMRHDPDKGVSSAIGEFGMPLTRGMAVSPDGREVLAALLDHESGDLVLVDHFR